MGKLKTKKGVAKRLRSLRKRKVIGTRKERSFLKSMLPYR